MSDLKVMTWNIWAKDNAQEVAQVIKDSGADIVGLQEVDNHYSERTAWQDIAKEVAASAAYDYFYFSPSIDVEGRDESERKQYGNALLSKKPLQEIEICQLYPGLEWDKTNHTTEPRTAISGVAELDGKRVRVINFHLGNTIRFEPDPIKTHQTETLIAFSTKDPLPVVLMGDANSLPDSPEVAMMEKHFRNADPSHALTWPLHAFSYKGWEEEAGVKYTIDYIFTSEDIRVKALELLDCDCSDHLPLLAHISFN